ncbi:MliC family protein [Parasphingorhabdus sp.]|uniref:MliC family protein n=1 Tax=Parasphingorhabdus sp. TaxID=2709688 RepID=UPI0032643153
MKLFLKAAIVAITFGCVGNAGPVSAQPDNDQPGNDQVPVFQADNAATVYVCENDMRLEVTFMAIADNSLISVKIPSSRAPEKSRLLLLPLSQSGSGVRYATDLASFHLKGKEATFTSVESAMSDLVKRTGCKQE